MCYPDGNRLLMHAPECVDRLGSVELAQPRERQTSLCQEVPSRGEIYPRLSLKSVLTWDEVTGGSGKLCSSRDLQE